MATTRNLPPFMMKQNKGKKQPAKKGDKAPMPFGKKPPGKK